MSEEKTADAAGSTQGTTADATQPPSRIPFFAKDTGEHAGDIIMGEPKASDVQWARGVDEPRTLPHFHYPIPREHTGKLQFRTDRAGTVSIDLIGDVHRGAVIAVRNEKFARGLIAGGSFANAPADAPLGQPEEYRPKPKEPVTDTAESKQMNPGVTEPPVTPKSPAK